MKYRFGTRVISFLLCIAMVLGMKLELPVNARAEGEVGDSNDIRRIWYVGDTINLAEVLPSGALVMWYDFKNVEIAVTLYNVYPWDTVVKRAEQAKALTEDVWVFDELYRYSESTTALQSALVNRIPNRPEPVGFTIVGPKTTDDGKVYYTFDALDYHYHNASGFEAWYEYDKLPDISGAGVKFFLTGDVYLTSTWNVPNGTTSLCLNGHSIYLKGDGDVIRVNKGSRLYIYDEEGEDRGTPGAIAHVGGVGNGVRVEGGHFGLYSGTIAGNTRGVYMNGGSFTMEGGSIDHNTVQDGHGGGVYMEGGTFYLNGGTIARNTVQTGHGGGVCIDGGGKYEMKGGTIEKNTVHSGNGGGVYLNGGDEIDITGGTISGNTVQTGNGGRYNTCIKRAYEAGHSIGVHSYGHNYGYIYSSEENFYTDFNAAQQLIYDQTGSYTQLYRFPGGSSNTVSRFNYGIMSRLSTELEDMGYRYFDWNVDSGDASYARNSAAVAANIINGCARRHCSVVLQHDIKLHSVYAVESVIQWGLENGYSFKALELSSPSAHQGIAN